MEKRTEKYRKNIDVESFLKGLNSDLAGQELKLMQKFSGEPLPIIFIVGCPRSGTSLLNQLLINKFGLAYPSNLMARFWEVPLCGAMMFKNLYPGQIELSLNSDLGYTQGAEGPHEFGYFWKSWLSDQSHNNKDQLKEVLDKLSLFYNNTIVFKNLHFVNSHISFLSELLPNSFFIHIKRDVLANACSLYKARLKFSGDASNWFGPKVKMPVDITLDSEHQIIHQIKSIEDSIAIQLDLLADSRKLELKFESLKNNPEESLSEIANKFDFLNPTSYNIPKDMFVKTNNYIQDNELVEKFNSIMNKYSL